MYAFLQTIKKQLITLQLQQWDILSKEKNSYETRVITEFYFLK